MVFDHERYEKRRIINLILTICDSKECGKVIRTVQYFLLNIIFSYFFLTLQIHVVLHVLMKCFLTHINRIAFTPEVWIISKVLLGT